MTQILENNEDKTLGAIGNFYYLSEDQIAQFQNDGFLHIHDVAPEETIKELNQAFTQLISDENNITKLGKDIADIDGVTGKPLEDQAGISIMLPSKYWPNLNQAILEKRCAHITEQLFGNEMLFDFDRFVAKKPNRGDAVFHWHQDKLYCATHGDSVNAKDDRAAIFSIALDDTNEENGCIKYVVGSHKEKELREHVDAHDNSKQSLFKVTKTLIDESKDKIVSVPLKKGDLTVHGNRVIHGSGGNQSSGWRRCYMIQIRSREQVEKRIALGISRSFNSM